MEIASVLNIIGRINRSQSVCILICSALSLGVPYIGAQKTEHQAHRWTPLDISFTGDIGEKSPLTIEFKAEVTCGREKLTVPGFWDGGKKFVIRFAPPSEGTWTYLTQSSLPELNGIRGTVETGPPPSGQRGPVRLNQDDLRRFVYADGSGYFPLAFEIDWLFALDAEDADDIPKTRQLIDYVGCHGFNQVVMNVYAYDVRWPRDPKLPEHYDYGKPDVFPYAGNNSDPDFSTLNIEYFQRFDRVIKELDAQGIVAHLMIYVWNKLVSWPESDSAADNLYFDYVIKRYQAFPNLIWDISKEATGYGHNDMDYILRRIERLRDLDGHGRLVTVHDYGYCNKYPESVDFISVQNWQSETWHVMRDIRKAHPEKAIFNIEHGGYEKGPYHVFAGNYYRPDVNLERAYHIVFAGAYPTHYWQDTSWNVVIHNIEELPVHDQPKLSYYKHLSEFAQKYNLNELEPDKGKANSGFCLSNKKDLFIYLVPKENDIIIPRPPRAGYNKIGITWFDPFSGSYSQKEEIKMEQWNRIAVPDPGRMKIMIMNMIP